MRISVKRILTIAAALALSFLAAPASAQMLAHLSALSVSSLHLPAVIAGPRQPLPHAVAFSDSPEQRFGFTFFAPADPTLPRQGGSANDLAPAAPRFTATVAAPSGLFGGVEVRVGKTAHAMKWDRLLRENGARYFEGDCDAPRDICSSPARRMIADAAAIALGEEPERAIRRINEAVNRAIRFTADIDQYGVSDHWADAAQTLRSGRGDCEDYAIVKYWALAAIGVPTEAMRLVIVRDVRRRLDHAVLALSLHGQNIVLDSLSNRVSPDAALGQYEPRLSLAADGSWVHGRYRPQIARADIPRTQSR